ncbi:MAG: prepilin peptidase [Tissierellia bacterium]|nr:prepilin peptidase [Tissierellia bacterium]
MKFFLFLFGVSIGSFINLSSVRLVRNESIIYPPSHCDSCNSRLKIIDLIPIISFLILKGRCRYCNCKIPVASLFTELTTGIITIIAFEKNNDIFSLILILTFLYLFIIISLIDLYQQEIYMSLVWICFIIGFIYRLYSDFYIFEFIKVSIVFTIIYILIYFISKKSIGDGDIYLYLMSFLFLENKDILTFVFISVWLAAIVGIIIGIKNKNFKTYMPFAIYILLAFVSVKLDILIWRI